jgi:glycine/D-amino acid oxidase-like deaminating enzyme
MMAGDTSLGPLTRRTVLKGTVALPLAGGLAAASEGSVVQSTGDAAEAAAEPRQVARPAGGLNVAVVGAGAFGGWTALSLLRRGARVTLLDAWGPGNARASSGGETRVIRGFYGPDRIYLDWVVRSFALWREHERRWGRPLYRRTGALWMFRGDDGYARTSMPLAREAGLPAAQLDLAAARRRFPQVDFAGVRSVYFEEEAGYLLARRACQSVLEVFLAEGGEYRQASVLPGALAGGRLAPLMLADGSTLAADAYVFACGPWLGKLFAPAVGGRVRASRQEVFFFGTPAGDPRWSDERLPVWIDFGERVFYGIPDNEARGLKVADDTRGEPFDPDAGERVPSPEALGRARRVLAERFPDLAGAPLVESRVCQYENSPDGHFLIGRHPGAGNAWLVGGGSGHGFKLGPAVGEHAAALVAGEAEPIAMFALDRPIAEGAREDQLSAGQEERDHR